MLFATTVIFRPTTFSTTGDGLLEDAVSAFLCGVNGDESTAPISQSDTLRFCIERVLSGTRIDTITQMSCTQDAITSVAIEDGTVSSSTMATAFATNYIKWKVETRLPSGFFSSSTPPPVTCTGSVELGLVSTGGARALKAIQQRELQTREANFAVEIQLRNDTAADGGFP